MSLFFVDNNCDLGSELIGKLSIECIDFPYSLDGETRTFDGDYDKLVSKARKLVKVEAGVLTSRNYVSIFEQCFKRDDDVVYLYTSEKIYDTKNLLKAKEKLDKAYPDRKLLLLDTANFSIAQGLISYDLAMKYRNGATLDELEEYFYKVKNEYTLYITMDSVESLVDGGLVPSTLVSGSGLSVKPILAVDVDGKFQLIEKVSGKKKAAAKLLDYIRKYGSNVADYPVGIVYAEDATLANELRDKVIEHFGEETKVIVGRLSPNNLGLIGLGGLGISFHVKKKVV